MKIKTETKYMIELDDQEVNEIFDQLYKLISTSPQFIPYERLMEFGDLLRPILRRGY